MGTWGASLLDDDLALDIRGCFEGALEAGESPEVAARGLMNTEVAREILEEFAEDERDDSFWEESRGLFYAVATIQLAHGVLEDDVRRQTLQAITAERRGLDREADAERWTILDELETRLGGK